jgi:cytochrome c oxidase cbb3-type subunit 3
MAAQAAAPPPIAHDAPPAPLPLGKVPLNPRGPAPRGFMVHPETTPAEIVHREFMRKARMMLLDARAPSDYIREHIEGAVSVPFYDPTPYFAKLPKDTWLVCYCSCPLAESGALAGKLQAAGFQKVTVLAEGIPYWKLHDYAVRTGPKP